MVRSPLCDVVDRDKVCRTWERFNSWSKKCNSPLGIQISPLFCKTIRTSSSSYADSIVTQKFNIFVECLQNSGVFHANIDGALNLSKIFESTFALITHRILPKNLPICQTILFWTDIVYVLYTLNNFKMLYKIYQFKCWEWNVKFSTRWCLFDIYRRNLYSQSFITVKSCCHGNV